MSALRLWVIHEMAALIEFLRKVPVARRRLDLAEQEADPDHRPILPESESPRACGR